MIHKVQLQGKGARQLLWLTDLHLDALDDERVEAFFREIVSLKPDALLIGGDVSNGQETFARLRQMKKWVNCPLYFVLGNHDYYGSSIKAIRLEAVQFAKEAPDVHYLTIGDQIPLSDQTVLLGHDGWSDGRAGNYFLSHVQLNDYFYIEELKLLSLEERYKKLNQLGDEAALALKTSLEKAFKNFKHIVLLIHTPPFKEACCYGGKPCDNNWAPHFVCQCVGDMLLKILQNRTDTYVTVLCGHAHNGVDLQVLPNLRVLTGHSEVGMPTVQGILNFS